MRYVLAAVVVVMGLASGVLAATNAPAAARKPLLLVQPVVQDAPVAQMAPARSLVDDGAVRALGGAVKAEGTACVTGLSGAVAGTNGLVVAGLSPAGRVMAAQVREIHGQSGVEDDAAFLGDVDVWRGGPLGEIITQAMAARRAGDQDAYERLLARYWAEYGAAMERRRGLGKTGTQRPVPGR